MKRPLRLLPILLVTTSLCSVASPSHAQTTPPHSADALPNPLTLQDAIRIALLQQPQQAIAQTQVTQARAASTQANALYLPTVSPTYQYQNTHQSFYGVSSGFNGVNIPISGASTVHGATGGLSIRENVLDIGQREVQNAQARHQVQSAGLNVRSTRQQVIVNVTQAFYELLRANDLKKVADAQAQRAQQVLDQTQGRIEAGVAPRIEISQSRADLANAQVSQLQAQDAIETDAAALKNAMGVETSAAPQPVPLAPGNQLPPAPQVEETMTADAYLPMAYTHRPDLLSQQNAVETSQLNVKQAKINAGLSLSGTAALNYTPVNDIGTKGNQYQFLIVSSYPLFDGGASHAAVRSAEAQRDAARDQLDVVRQQVRLEVEQASVQRAESFKRIQLARLAVDAAQANYDSVVESQREGIATNVEVTTAEVTLTQAQNQYVTAIYDFYEADARLSKALGVNDAGVAPR